MQIGFIVGIILSLIILFVGIIGLFLSKNNSKKSKWAWPAIIFGVCGLISAVINSKILP